MDAMVAEVIALTFAKATTHTVVSGGFGAGKSYALARAIDVAAKAGLRVAALARGPLGISSYADFLVAVAQAVRQAGRSQVDVSSWRRELSDELHDVDLDELERRVLGGPRDSALVLVIESVDQLLHQIRSTDRPRLIDLLTRKSPRYLILGSAHGTGLVDELGEHIRFVRAEGVPDSEAAAELAVQEARRLGAESPVVSERLLSDAAALDPAISSNWLFWSLVGRYLVVAKRDPLRWAEEDLRNRAASHFDAMLLTLAPSEQRVLLALAEAGGPRSVGELADSIGVRNQAAATALGRLLADDWVQIVDMSSEFDRRRTWYDIADRLLRAHLTADRADGRMTL
jgi:DNA-binding MarR family transcriptional regulator